MKVTRAGLMLVMLGLVAGCANGAPEPGVLAAGAESCSFCRMTLSQPEFAGQLVVAGELPKFFDDLGCLNRYLTATTPPADPYAIYVMDHADKTWLRADTAVFGHVATLSTPMGSHLVAHASLAVKDTDPDMTGWVSGALCDVVPPRWRRPSAGKDQP